MTSLQLCLSTALGVTEEHLPVCQDILYSQNQGEVWKGSYISLIHIGLMYGDTALTQPHEKPGASQKYMHTSEGLNCSPNSRSIHFLHT